MEEQDTLPGFEWHRVVVNAADPHGAGMSARTAIINSHGDQIFAGDPLVRRVEPGCYEVHIQAKPFTPAHSV